jgi:hypothetical protein
MMNFTAANRCICELSIIVNINSTRVTHEK